MQWDAFAIQQETQKKIFTSLDKNFWVNCSKSKIQRMWQPATERRRQVATSRGMSAVLM